MFAILHPQRDALQKHLQEAGIGTVIHYPIPPHLQDAYAELNLGAGSFPISEAIHQQIISLPLDPYLSVEEVRQVAAAVRSFQA